jgi:hypothetical protein
MSSSAASTCALRFWRSEGRAAEEADKLAAWRFSASARGFNSLVVKLLPLSCDQNLILIRSKYYDFDCSNDLQNLMILKVRPLIVVVSAKASQRALRSL